MSTLGLMMNGAFCPSLESCDYKGYLTNCELYLHFYHFHVAHPWAGNAGVICPELSIPALDCVVRAFQMNGAVTAAKREQAASAVESAADGI